MISSVSYSIYAAPKPSPQTDYAVEILKAEEKCSVEYPSITQEFLKELKLTRNMKGQEENRDFKCFISCIGAEIQAVDTDGQLMEAALTDMTKDILHEEIEHGDANDMVTKCMDAAGQIEDICDRVFGYALCKVDQWEGLKFPKTFCPHCHE